MILSATPACGYIGRPAQDPLMQLLNRTSLIFRKNVKKYKDVTKKCRLLIDEIERRLNIPVTILNTGKAYDCLIDLIDNYKPVDWENIRGIVDNRARYYS